MGPIKLELRSPKNQLGLGIDPNPDWTIDGLLSDLNVLQSKFSTFSLSSKESPQLREVSNGQSGIRGKKSFVIRVSEDDEIDDWGGEDGEVEVRSGRILVPAYRLDCHDISLSDDSEDESTPTRAHGPAMEKTKVADVMCLALYEYQLGVQEEIKNQLSSLVEGFQTANDKFISSLVQVEKNAERRREMDRNLDLQYQHKIAEVLDSHLNSIQRDHEHRSRLEEKRIKDDAALEDTRRKEKAFQEEKLRQQKASAEKEARIEAAKRADDARKAALEAERKALVEAAEKLAKENAAKAAASAKTDPGNQKESNVDVQSSRVVVSDASVSEKPIGSIVRAAESALKLEEKRRHMYLEFDERTRSLNPSSNKDFVSYERKVGRVIRQISGSVENVRAKANDLIEILNNSIFPRPVSMLMLAKKVISVYEAPNISNSSAFACGHVVVLVSAQVPQFMDVLVAEFHRVCIYAVPKHLVYSKSTFEVKEAYFKAIGYREEDGKFEETERYLDRLESCMKLYGAVVQTQIDGVQNMHGLEEGWAWLARFLNALPVNRNTAVALVAFLSMAGYALHRKYKSQFRKLLGVIDKNFLHKLKLLKEDPKVNIKVRELQEYIESNKFLIEPEGSHLQGSLLSRALAPQDDRQEQNYYSPNRYFY